MPAEPARRHVAALLDAGVSAAAVSRASGVHVVTVRRLLAGASRLRRSTTLRLEGVGADVSLDKESLQDATTCARLE